ncbi:MAG: peptidoglycan bridge formation glycyltransferase FemA/FemB family protein [Saccharofermentanales bacterium]
MILKEKNRLSWQPGCFYILRIQFITLLSGSYDHFNKLNAPFLIQHRIMQEAVNNDVEIYNMLGIDGDFSGADSIYEFKKSFAGYAEQKVGMFHWIAQPLKYKMIEGLKEILGRN